MAAGGRSSPFLNSVREAIRVRHYSIRTEQAYIDWIKRFILFHDKKHPNGVRVKAPVTRPVPTHEIISHQ
jgi:hypothetical protein